MDTKSCIRRMIDLSMEKLSLMRKKSRVVKEEVKATQVESVDQLDAIEQMKHVLEEKLLVLDIEFLKFYGHVMDREGISNLGDIDLTENPELKDLKTVVGKILEVEERVITAEDEVNELRLQHERSLGPKRKLKKMGQQVSNAYRKQKQVGP